MKIAVVGGGIFGSVAAIFLSQEGHQVSLFEQHNDLLMGASRNNQNRLHLGFHYPRDFETAQQSLKGFNEFRRLFEEECFAAFPMYYAISAHNSRTNAFEYQTFMKKANLNFENVDIRTLTEFGLDTKTISHAWKVFEGVVDNDLLRDKIRQKLQCSGAELRFAEKVYSVSLAAENWIIELASSTETFDVVIKATYGVDEITYEKKSSEEAKSLYQATLVMECEFPATPFGITVMDGDFISVLPKGRSSKFLIYAPTPSVLGESSAPNHLEHFLCSPKAIQSALTNLESRFISFFPEYAHSLANTQGLTTIRNLEAKSIESAKRVSKIERIAENFFNIRSGKIDHSIEIAIQLCEILRR
jgi:hypothetical protein